jgi:mannobiose 2-epimerase
VEYALRRVLDMFQLHIINRRTGHLGMFFSMDWTPASERWESYGHDIECSWLMHEAVLLLNQRLLVEQVEPDVRLLAKASEKGLQPDGSMIHEAGMAAGDTDRHWWVQAEAVVGFANIYQHFGEKAAAEKALRLWDYTKRHLIDTELGEWHWSCDKDGKVNRNEDHAGFWKCPYHNGRMCLELIERF